MEHASFHPSSAWNSVVASGILEKFICSWPYPLQLWWMKKNVITSSSGGSSSSSSRMTIRVSDL
jgi:hypothetical protein